MRKTTLLLACLAMTTTANAQFFRNLGDRLKDEVEEAVENNDDTTDTAAAAALAPDTAAQQQLTRQQLAAQQLAAQQLAAQQAIAQQAVALPLTGVAASMPYCNPASLAALRGDEANRLEKVVINRLIDQVLDQVGLEGAELQAPITSRCDAQRRFAYVTQYTGFWSSNVIGAVENAATALQLDHQNEAYRAFQEDVPFGDHSSRSIAQLEKDLSGELGLIEEAMAQGEVANAELLDRAIAEMRVAVAQGLHIVSWDRKLAEFMGDDTDWTRENLDALRLFVDHAKLLGRTLGSIGRVTEARQASGETGGDDERMQRFFDEAAERDAASRAELEALYQL